MQLDSHWTENKRVKAYQHVYDASVASVIIVFLLDEGDKGMRVWVLLHSGALGNFKTNSSTEVLSAEYSEVSVKITFVLFQNVRYILLDDSYWCIIFKMHFNVVQ